MRRYAALAKELEAIRAQFSAWVNMAVQGLTGDAEFGAKVGDFCPRFSHGSLCGSQLRRRHLVRPTAMSTAGTRRCEPRAGTLDNQFPFEFRQSGEKAEHQLSVRCGGVNRSALAGENLQPYATTGEIMDQINEMSQVAAKPVKFPDCEGIAGAQTLQACVKAGAIVTASGGAIFIQPFGCDADGKQRVALQVENLGAVSF